MRCACRNPIHCIVPPQVLESVLRSEDERKRAAAIDTLSLDQSVRAARLVNAQRRGRVPALVDALAFAGAGQPNRTIRDANNTQNPSPPTIARAEGQGATGDAAVDEAYDGFGDTYTLYWDIYRRDSIDGAGMPLNGTVHYGRNYDNAFWDGRRMVFGDGDGVLFNRFTIALDVIGHELTHGVTEHESGLNYWGQSGALNESASDVFGSLVKQYKRGQTADQADWLIGEGLLAEGVNGVALRSMKAPGTAYDDPDLGKDPQPATMSDYVRTIQDNGGVHINSGIPNHAFYLVATKLGGYAWERAGRIWYETCIDPSLTPTTRFRKFARTTVAVAKRLYGEASDEVAAVEQGWEGVQLDF
jgi:Zn-dependent metalloprotease